MPEPRAVPHTTKPSPRPPPLARANVQPSPLAGRKSSVQRRQRHQRRQRQSESRKPPLPPNHDSRQQPHLPTRIARERAPPPRRVPQRSANSQPLGQSEPHAPATSPCLASKVASVRPAASKHPPQVRSPQSRADRALRLQISRCSTLRHLLRNALRCQPPRTAQLALNPGLNLRNHRQRNRLRAIAAKIKPNRSPSPLAALANAAA